MAEKNNKNVEQGMGIEPMRSRWQRERLPLHHPCVISNYMKTFLAVLLSIFLLVPVIAEESKPEDPPKCEPYDEFLTGFANAAKESSMKYMAYRLDKEQALDLIKSLDVVTGYTSPSKYYDDTTGALVIITGNDLSLIGLFHGEEEKTTVCYSSILPMSVLLQAFAIMKVPVEETDL